MHQTPLLLDRKSTRLNSSHSSISYAVFCLKKKIAIPLNCWHQHFNGSGQAPARYVAVTNGPAVMNLYDDVNFVFNTAYDFKNRFAGEPDYFTPKTEPKGFLLPTNFVPDAVNLPLISAKERGAGGGHIRFNMAKGSMS